VLAAYYVTRPEQLSQVLYVTSCKRPAICISSSANLMQRYKQHSRVILKQFLRAIAAYSIQYSIKHSIAAAVLTTADDEHRAIGLLLHMSNAA
jgi:predicted GIY-YIG superfamily endonuclease